MIKLFFKKNTFSSTAEKCSIIGLRFGTKILLGIAFKLWKIKNDIIRKIIGKIFPIFYLSFLRHTGQSDRIEIFRIQIVGTKFSFTTKGEKTKCKFSFLWWTYNKYGE